MKGYQLWIIILFVLISLCTFARFHFAKSITKRKRQREKKKALPLYRQRKTNDDIVMHLLSSLYLLRFENNRDFLSKAIDMIEFWNFSDQFGVSIKQRVYPLACFYIEPNQSLEEYDCFFRSSEIYTCILWENNIGESHCIDLHLYDLKDLYYLDEEAKYFILLFYSRRPKSILFNK